MSFRFTDQGPMDVSDRAYAERVKLEAEKLFNIMINDGFNADADPMNVPAVMLAQAFNQLYPQNPTGISIYIDHLIKKLSEYQTNMDIEAVTGGIKTEGR